MHTAAGGVRMQRIHALAYCLCCFLRHSAKHRIMNQSADIKTFRSRHRKNVSSSLLFIVLISRFLSIFSIVFS